MSRVRDIERLYLLLGALRRQHGGYRQLANCTGRTGWPQQGVYFFFETTEPRAVGNDLRVVRVGTHAISGTSSTTLWNRLAQHRGSQAGNYAGGGNHRGSVFRLHVGTAFLRHGLQYQNVADSWSKGNTASEVVRTRELELERCVSRFIGEMPFLWLAVPGSPGSTAPRRIIEATVIALLSNRGRDPIDPPSATWLGRWAASQAIRESGLWNVDHVDQHQYDPAGLELLARFVGPDSNTKAQPVRL